ncbi:MAG: PDZ domain-containing protein [Pirellulales bacterium]
MKVAWRREWCVWILLAVTPAGGAAGSTAEPTRAEELAFRAAVERVTGAVVQVELVGGSRVAVNAAAEAAAGTGASTGLVVDPAGLVLTTAFAVPDDASVAVVVLPDGRRLATQPLGRDRPRGIVLLKTQPIPGAPPVEAVPRADLRAGQWTIAVGRAWTAAKPNVAVGILSAVDRGWGLAVQTDAAVSPVTYGGPLIDIRGRVIGILAPLAADTAGMKQGTELYDAGIGFAVPLADLLPLLPRLAAGETLAAGKLGMGYTSRDDINGEPMIGSVRRGSPAARAGLRGGDRIVSIDGRAVTRIADVRHALVPRHAGDRVEFTVARDGGQVTVAADLVDALPPWRRGLLGIVAGDEARDQAEDGEGMRVAWVLPGSPADGAGIAAGDRVRRIAPADGVDAEQRSSASSTAGLLAALEPGTSVRLVLDRDGTERTAEATLVPLPSDVPAAGPPAAAVDPLAGPVDAVTVMRLEAAEVADPPLAVVPRGGREPVPVLVYTGDPHGPALDAEAVAWKAAVAATGVAVILPGSADRRQWSRADIPAVLRGLQSLNAKRPVDPTRVAVAGRGAGGAFAWLVADRLGAACRGVAVADAVLPRGVDVPPAEPGAARWVLLGGGEPVAARIADDRARLMRAGHDVGSLPSGEDRGPPADLLCRWASLLGLL